VIKTQLVVAKAVNMFRFVRRQTRDGTSPSVEGFRLYLPYGHDRYQVDPLSSPRTSVRCSSSHHPMIGKELPRLIITPGVGQLGILGGVLHVLMAHPVLHEAELAAGVEEVGGDGVLKAVELPLLRRQARPFAIRLHGAPERAPINRHAAVGDEQIRRRVGPRAQVRAQEFDHIGLQRIDA
jgi:hypothetical protein